MASISRLQSWKRALILGALMFINYGLNAVSFRATAKGSYIGLALTDAMIAWWGFAMLQRVAAAETRVEKIGYTLGGMLGSMFGLWSAIHFGT